MSKAESTEAEATASKKRDVINAAIAKKLKSAALLRRRAEEVSREAARDLLNRYAKSKSTDVVTIAIGDNAAADACAELLNALVAVSGFSGDKIIAEANDDHVALSRAAQFP